MEEESLFKLSKREFENRFMALVFGAFTGGAVTAAAMIVVMVGGGSWPTGTMIELYFAAFVLIVLVPAIAQFAMMGWMLGLFLIAGPLWLVLERLGFRSLAAALVFGFVLTFLASLLWLWAQLPPPLAMANDSLDRAQFYWQSAFGFAALNGGIGLLVAAVVWRRTYRREDA